MKLRLILLTMIAACVLAPPAQSQTSTSRAAPTPRPTAKGSANSDDLKTIEILTARVDKLEEEKSGWVTERVGLTGTIETLTVKVQLITEQKDFFRTAAVAGKKLDENNQKIDQNSQAIDAKSELQISYLRGDLATTQRERDQLRDRLDSCQSSQKYYFVAGVVTGGIGGYMLRGATQQLGGVNPFARPLSAQRSEAERQILKPAAANAYDFSNKVPGQVKIP